MARHRRNRRGIKIHRSYSVEEVARSHGVAKGTVRRWIKSGLPALTDRKPTLILGADLMDFLKARAAPKQRCKPHECYCVKCRAPRAPAEAMAEFVPLTPTTGNLRALCPICTTLMHKRIAVVQLEAIRAVLDVTAGEARERITDSPHPSLNDHVPKEPSSHA